MHNIACFVKEIDSKEYSKENFQMQARELRYQFYREIANKYNLALMSAPFK